MKSVDKPSESRDSEINIEFSDFSSAGSEGTGIMQHLEQQVSTLNLLP